MAKPKFQKKNSPNAQNKMGAKGVKKTESFKKKNKEKGAENGINLQKNQNKKQGAKGQKQNKQQPLGSLKVMIPDSVGPEKAREAFEMIYSQCEDRCTLSGLIFKSTSTNPIPQTIKSLGKLNFKGTKLTILPYTDYSLNPQKAPKEKKPKEERVMDPLRRTFVIPNSHEDLDTVKDHFDADSVAVVGRTKKGNLKVCALTYSSEEEAIKASTQSLTLDKFVIKLKQPYIPHAKAEEANKSKKRKSSESSQGSTKKAKKEARPKVVVKEDDEEEEEEEDEEEEDDDEEEVEEDDDDEDDEE